MPSLESLRVLCKEKLFFDVVCKTHCHHYTHCILSAKPTFTVTHFILSAKATVTITHILYCLQSLLSP